VSITGLAYVLKQHGMVGKGWASGVQAAKAPPAAKARRLKQRRPLNRDFALSVNENAWTVLQRFLAMAGNPPRLKSSKPII
jgi:hypothetical protein